jgi:hypothetical protein
VIQQLWTVYRDEDATLVEVNPLVKTTDGAIIALDGKVSLDENAAFRHPGHEALEDKEAADPLEAKAKAKGLNYVKLDGSVGIIGNGAGLVMSTLDVVAYAGEEFGGVLPANFLDIGGGASAEVMADGLDIILGDEQVKSVFVNVFGGSPRATRWPTASSRRSRSSATARPSRSSSASTATTSTRDAGFWPRRPIRWSPSSTPWTVPRAPPPSSLRRQGAEMAIFLTRDSKVIVQGMTGSEGRKHTQRMLASGTQIVGGVTPGKAGQSVEFDGGAQVPVFGSVAEAVEVTART